MAYGDDDVPETAEQRAARIAANQPKQGGLKGINCVENPRDTAMLHEAIRRRPQRWRGLNDEVKDEIVADVQAGRRRARSIMDASADPLLALAAIDRIHDSARVCGSIDRLSQADEHHERDADRNDALAGVAIAGAVRQMTPEDRARLIETARAKGILGGPSAS